VAGGDRENSLAGLVLAARRAGVADVRVLAVIGAIPRVGLVPAGYVRQRTGHHR
jgi:hypothetical protein